jgi:hypothetical protein
MSDKKPIHEGYQPVVRERGYQPKPAIPAGAPIVGGYQPPTGEGAPKLKPPPKKP